MRVGTPAAGIPLSGDARAIGVPRNHRAAAHERDQLRDPEAPDSACRTEVDQVC